MRKKEPYHCPTGTTRSAIGCKWRTTALYVLFMGEKSQELAQQHTPI